MNIHRYLFIHHDYSDINCISLLSLIYKQEFGIDLQLPTYNSTADWYKFYTTEQVDEWANKHVNKINLTDADNYDLIVFSTRNKKRLFHFGMYLKPNKFLHIEEGKTSRVETLDTYWVDRIYAIYRHNDLV